MSALGRKLPLENGLTARRRTKNPNEMKPMERLMRPLAVCGPLTVWRLLWPSIVVALPVSGRTTFGIIIPAAIHIRQGHSRSDRISRLTKTYAPDVLACLGPSEVSHNRPTRHRPRPRDAD